MEEGSCKPIQDIGINAPSQPKQSAIFRNIALQLGRQPQHWLTKFLASDQREGKLRSGIEVPGASNGANRRPAPGQAASSRVWLPLGNWLAISRYQWPLFLTVRTCVS